MLGRMRSRRTATKKSAKTEEKPKKLPPYTAEELRLMAICAPICAAPYHLPAFEAWLEDHRQAVIEWREKNDLRVLEGGGQGDGVRLLCAMDIPASIKAARGQGCYHPFEFFEDRYDRHYMKLPHDVVDARMMPRSSTDRQNERKRRAQAAAQAAGEQVPVPADQEKEPA